MRESQRCESPAASMEIGLKKKRKGWVAGTGAACRRKTKVGQFWYASSSELLRALKISSTTAGQRRPAKLTTRTGPMPTGRPCIGST